jgi:hypothetical protein
LRTLASGLQICGRSGVQIYSPSGTALSVSNTSMEKFI